MEPTSVVFVGTLVAMFLIICRGVYNECRIRREYHLRREAREMERLVADNPGLRKLAETIAKANNPFAGINATLHRIQATTMLTYIHLPLADETDEPATTGMGWFPERVAYPTQCRACKAVAFHTPESREYMRKHGYCSPKCGYRPCSTAPAVPTLPG